MKDNSDDRLVLIIAVPYNLEHSEVFENNSAGISLFTLLNIHKTLTRFALDWEIGSIDGEKALVHQDINTEEAQEFYRNNLGKINSTRNLEEIKGGEYKGIIVPSMKGLMGIHKSQSVITKLGPTIKQVFLEAKCTIFSGYGILSTFDCKGLTHNWMFAGYNLTSLSLIQQSTDDKFSQFPFLIEDKVRELGGNFCWNDSSSELLILDKKVVTIQDDKSIKIACNTFGYILGENS